VPIAAQKLAYMDLYERLYFPLHVPLAAVCGPTDAALSLGDIRAYIPGVYIHSFVHCI
jgi:hypothetical protein